MTDPDQPGSVDQVIADTQPGVTDTAGVLRAPMPVLITNPTVPPADDSEDAAP